MSLFKVCGVEEIGSSCLTNVTPLIESYNFWNKSSYFWSDKDRER